MLKGLTCKNTIIMPKKLDYTITIKNIFTNQINQYLIQRGTIEQVAHRINTHYGTTVVSHSICANIISRPDMTATKYHNITIEKNTSNLRRVTGTLLNEDKYTTCPVTNKKYLKNCGIVVF